MKTTFMLLSALVSILSLSACDLDTRTDEQKRLEQQTADLKRKIDEERRKTESADDELQDRLAPGGQPGKFSVYGIIVNNGQLEDRITLDVKTGRNRHGEYPEIEEAQKPKLSEKFPTPTIETLGSYKYANAFGCTKEVAEAYAESRGLLLHTYREDNPFVFSFVSVEADLAIFCGTPSELKNKSLFIKSKEIIFDNFDFKISDTFNSVEFQTENLILIGKNRISSSGSTFISPPSVSLTVEKGISSEADGSLVLYSHGIDMNQK